MTIHQSTTAMDGRSSLISAPESPDAGFDLYRLDCIADALIAGPPLSRAERQELARIIENLTALKETPNGHAH